MFLVLDVIEDTVKGDVGIFFQSGDPEHTGEEADVDQPTEQVNPGPAADPDEVDLNDPWMIPTWTLRTTLVRRIPTWTTLTT